MRPRSRSYRAPGSRALHDPSERYALDEVVYTARDGGLLQVVHDLDELRKTSGDGVEAALRGARPQERVALRLGRLGQEGVGAARRSTTRTSCRCTRAHSNLFWAERYGREIGVDDLWIKQCGNSHTGSFKDLGMTVLVSMVKEMIARGKPIRAVACASTGDTSAALSAYAAAAGIPAIVFLPRGKISVGAADPAGRERRDRVRARHRLRRLHGDREAGRREGRHLPRELDEQPAHRGPEDGRHRDRAAVRLGGARLDRDPGRQPRQRVGARRRAST